MGPAGWLQVCLLAGWFIVQAPAAVVWVPEGSVWRFRAGTNEASSPIGLWRLPEFDDAAAGFRDAAAPFWYGDPQTGGTELTDMQNRYRCIFLRHRFVVTNAAIVQQVRLRTFVDDGLVAWINGQEVLRIRMPSGEPTVNTLAQNAPEPVMWEIHPLTVPAGVLRSGTNVLAVQVFNTSLGSSDLGFDARLEGVYLDTNPPVILRVEPSPGEITDFTEVVVTFSEPVTGVDADDLWLNGVPALAVRGEGAVYRFRWMRPPYGTLRFQWAAGHGITDLAEPPLAFDGAAAGAVWEYDFRDRTPPAVVRLHPPAGLRVRRLEEIEVTFSEPIWGLDAADLEMGGRPARYVASRGEGVYVFTFDPPASGAVQVRWVAQHGITDTAAEPNAFGGGSWTYEVDPAAPGADLVITEILAGAVRSNGLLDEDGELQDWIEIYNRGTEPVNLANWSLSDDPTVPGRWVFPERVLGPNQYLVVFASGKDRRSADPQVPLHTNFRLALGGEPLGLYSPDAPRARVSGWDRYPEQRNDVSYGLDPLGQWSYYDVPTPGAPNGFTSLTGVCAEVRVNVQRGHFEVPFDLVLSCATPGVEFRYTTDGSEPTPDSPLFPGRLRVDRTTLFRAAAFKPGHLPSRVVTHSYFFGLPAPLRSLPTLSLVTASNHLYGPSGILGIQGGTYAGGPWQPVAPGDYHNPSQHGLAWERPVSVEWIEPGDGRGFQADAGIRVQGSDYQRPRLRPTSKFSYRLYFRSDYGPGRLEYPLFPLTPVQRFDQLVLRAGFNEPDNPFVRDELTRRLSSDMGQIASHGTLAIVFLNGRYYVGSPWYNPCERVHEEFFQEHLGGGAEWDVVGPGWAQTAGTPGVIDGDRADFDALVNYVWSQTTFPPVVYSNVARWLDLTNFADYLILNTWAATGDWPVNNWRAGRDRAGGPWRFVVWDAEWAMGFANRSVTLNSFTLSGPGPTDSGLGSTAGSEIARMFQRLRTSGEFRLLWADRVHKHFSEGGALSTSNLWRRLNELRQQLEPLMPDFSPTIGNWIRERGPIYSNQLLQAGLFNFTNAPRFNHPGGRVPLGFELVMTNNGAGVIYYTTNGGDPRVPFTSGVAPDARPYTGPIRVTADLTVRARSLAGATWSAISEATFRVGGPGVPLRITELHYNPAGGSAEEFLELANLGGTALDVSGFWFEGITFRFPLGTVLPPGARVVLASNTDTNAWRQRYPGVMPFGWFGGNLANGGERIVLRDAQGRVVTAVEFDDERGWPTEPDGGGPSLELVDPWGNPLDPGNWRASAAAGGSPGAPNSPALPGFVQIHEIMADNRSAVPLGAGFPDWIELHNAGGQPVDLSGWSLTDDDDPRRFVFPAGTTLPAGGYLVVWCNAQGAPPGALNAGFGLDRQGDAVFLYDAQTNRVDAVVFGLQVPDRTLGRWQGRWTLTEPTPGTANRPAAMADPGQLALNEWLPGPAMGQPAWVELFNRSSDLPVALEGLWLAADGTVVPLWVRAFLPPQSHLLLRLDDGAGPNWVPLTLPAAGRLALYDPAGGLLDSVTYTAAGPGVAMGRYPDGADAIMSFPGSSTPGRSNELAVAGAPRLHEILARNRSVPVRGRVADFVELYNPTSTILDLTGMRLSLQPDGSDAWSFPSGSWLGPFEFMVVLCDPTQPPSMEPGQFNLGRGLPAEGGGVYVWDALGRRLDSIEYGPQVADLSVGVAGSVRTLLERPTPGAANAPAARLGSPTVLRINEWMAEPLSGSDWFELYNPSSWPVDLGGLIVTDDPSLAGRERHRVAPLSYIAPGGFVRFIADGEPGRGADHVSFALEAAGEALVLYWISNGVWVVVDNVGFGAAAPGVSQGRLPDGGPTFVEFPGTATPGASNYRPLATVVIHEVLAHSDPPFEDAIELYNPTDQPVDIGGWGLSNDGADRLKFRIPEGTVVPPKGFVVFYEGQFGAPSLGDRAFGLSSTHGEELWLTEVRQGLETGRRDVVRWGASFNGQAFGRVTTSAGVEFAPLARPTFGVSEPRTLEEFRTGRGGPNAPPQVGPVVVNEVHYHPAESEDVSNEWIELHNLGEQPVALYDPEHPTNTWRVAGGIAYAFPPGALLVPGGFALVVDFDPNTDPVRATAFRARYDIPAEVPLYGPFAGRLDNAGDTVELQAPDRPEGPNSGQPGYVPYVRVDRVAYTDAVPWPRRADGGGHSLQKALPWLYGNEPLHWGSAPPTPGRPNRAGAPDTDSDGMPDYFERAHGFDSLDRGDAAGDADGDGASNLHEWAAGTDPRDPASRLCLEVVRDEGRWRLRFPAEPHRSYTVLVGARPESGAWQALTNVPARTVRRMEEIELSPAGTASRYYRVMTPGPTP